MIATISYADTTTYESWCDVPPGLAMKSQLKERGLRAVLPPTAYMVGVKYTYALHRVQEDCLPIGTRKPQKSWIHAHQMESTGWAQNALAEGGHVAAWSLVDEPGVGLRIYDMAIRAINGSLVMRCQFEQAVDFIRIYDHLRDTLAARPLYVWNAAIARTQLDDTCAFGRTPPLSPQLKDIRCVGMRYDRWKGEWSRGGFQKHDLPGASGNPANDCERIRWIIREMAQEVA